MNKAQNYLDQYVCDKLSFRVMFGNCTSTFENVFRNISQHEQPHIIILLNCLNSVLNFVNYQEIQYDHENVRVWHLFRHSSWKGNKIIYNTIPVPSPKNYIFFRISQHCESDQIPDPKKRFNGKSHIQQFLNAVGNVYYSEYRQLSSDILLFRIYTNQAKTCAIKDRLPLYLLKPHSLKGRFLFHITQKLVDNHSSEEIFNTLVTIKNYINKLTGHVGLEIMQKNFRQDLIDRIIDAKLLEQKQHNSYIMTPRGHFLLYYSSFISSI
jgi:hypothetical protein